jgi:glycosyltransferase involved in cell wall biosynthesis
MSTSRVLHVFKHFRPEFTGEGIFLERLAPIFQRLRPDIAHEVAVTETPRPGEFVPPAGLETVHFLGGQGGTRQSKLVSWLARNGGNYATVHYHTHVDRSFAASMLLRLRSCRLVLSATLDDSLPGLLKTYRPLHQPVVRLLSRVINAFVAISPRLFEENNRMVPPAKSAFIPIGIAIPPPRSDATRAAARRKLQIADDAVMLVSVGGICARKDQLFLVEQMSVLACAHPDILLVLVGPVVEPAYRAELEAAVARAHLEAHVQFAGYREPWDFYDAADVMVFASREEGFGTVVIEAMARGLPVLVRRLPGVNDAFVEDGCSGLFFDDAAGFRAGAIALADDPALRQWMGERGHALVASRYDIAGVAARYLDLYGFPVEAAA